MTVQDWFEKRKEAQIQRRALEARVEIEANPDLWTKCVHCDAQLLKKDIEDNNMVCPVCDYHFRVNARTRIKQLFDEGSFEELFTDIKPTDPLEFVDTESYKDRIEAAQKKTGLNDAVVTGLGTIDGQKVTRAMEKAIELKLPVLVITSSGGARMQESALSLMQMAKTACACAKLDEAGLLYINLITDPTFGGVTASFGTLGDIIVAEQGARVGFAGRRVIEQTIRQKLPADFQTAEYLMKYGQVDVVSSRKDLKATIANILAMHE